MSGTPRSRFAGLLLRGQTDERLVALAREGREPAFEEIVRRYRPGLVAFAAAYAPSDRAEDVVQESFVRAWDALRDSTSEIRLRPWLYTIVRNRALNARRDARHHEPIPEDFDGVPQPPDVVLGAEELASVVAAVRSLPDAQREALVRSSLEGHTHEQIAGALGTTPGAARQLIYRARATVRNGASVLIPLPVIRALVETGPHHAEAAVGAGAIAAGSIGGAGAGTAGGMKGATVLAVAAVAAGGGVALERARDVDPAQRVDLATPAAIGSSDEAGGSGSDRDGEGSGGPGSSEGSGPGGGGTRGHEGGEGDDDRGDGDRSGPSASSGPGDDGTDLDDDSSGPGPGGDDGLTDVDNSGPGGGGDSGDGGSVEDNSGPGGGGSSGPSLSSGSGSSGSETTSGSGTSGSGTSGSGSSGSGSGEIEPESEDSSGSG